MEALPASVAERLQALIHSERAVAYLQVDAGLTLVDAGGHLEAYGLAALRSGEPLRSLTGSGRRSAPFSHKRSKAT